MQLIVDQKLNRAMVSGWSEIVDWSPERLADFLKQEFEQTELHQLVPLVADWQKRQGGRVC